jgi:trk system potassium uptake protein TrkA
LYILIAGGGKIGANLARSLLRDGHGHEVTLIEQRRDRFDQLEHELEHQVQMGDATEIHVLERAGVARPPDVVAAVTGDDEDNLIICQLAREKYGVSKVVARVNDPRNQAHFDLLGISATVSATASIMALIEHEVPDHDLIHLLELRKENLEIVEVQIPKGAPSVGKKVERLPLPEGARLISVMRNGQSEIAVGSTELHEGDQVLAVLQPGKEDELRRVLLQS